MGPKIPYLGILGLESEKTIGIFEISTLKCVTSESLTHTVNFGVGPAFSKGPGSAFSEGPGPGPLYKVCHPKGLTEIFIYLNERFTPSWHTFRKNDDDVLNYKLEENKMSILEVTDCIRIDSELHVQPFSKGAPVPLPQWFRQEIVVCLAKLF